MGGDGDAGGRLSRQKIENGKFQCEVQWLLIRCELQRGGRQLLQAHSTSTAHHPLGRGPPRGTNVPPVTQPPSVLPRKGWRETTTLGAAGLLHPWLGAHDWRRLLVRFPQCLRRTRGWGWSRGDTSMSSTTRGRSTGGIHVNTITVAMDTASSSARHSSLSSSLAAAASSASGSTLGCSQVGQDVCMCVCVCDLIIDGGV